MLVSTVIGTLHNTIGSKLIWDCPIDGDQLFKALFEPVVQPNTRSECVQPIPLAAFEQATKPIMATSMMKPLIRVLRLLDVVLTHPPSKAPLNKTQGSVKYKPLLPRPTSRLYQLSSEFDRSTQSGLEYNGGGGAESHSSLLTMLFLLLSHSQQVPPVEFRSCS